MYLRRPLCVFCLLFTALLTGLLYISGEKNTLTPNEPSITGRHLDFEGTVEGIEEKNDRLVLQIKNISISDSNILLYPENLPKDKIHIGSRIRAEGSFSLLTRHVIRVSLIQECIMAPEDTVMLSTTERSKAYQPHMITSGIICIT